MVPELALELRPMRPLQQRATLGHASPTPAEYAIPFGEYQARRDSIREPVQHEASAVIIAIVTDHFIASNYSS